MKYGDTMSQVIRDYLLMSGYGGFVWPAYGVAALVLIGFAVDSWQRLHKATAALQQLDVAATEQVSLSDTGRKRGQQAGS